MRWILSLITGAVLLAGCGQAVNAPVLKAAAAAEASQAFAGRPVLLVHGHNGTAADWDTLLPWLRQEGFQPKAITFHTRDWNPEDMAAQLAVYAEAFARESGQPKINIVAHSLGAVVSRHYIKFLGGEKRVSHFVSLGAPHHGISATRVLRLDISPFMAPRSRFLDRLNGGDETPGEVVYSSIWSTSDYTQLLPFGSGRLKGAFNFRTSGTSHSGMLTDARLYPTVKEGLLLPPGAEPGPERRI